MALELRGINKFYHGTQVLCDINLTIEKGQFCVIVGPSGTGKTTLLNVLSGLEKAESGTVMLDGIKLDNICGKMGMIFQEGSLLPWRTVAGNVELGLLIQHKPKQERKRIVERYLQLVGLEKYNDHFPHQISGGMAQLASLAQVLAYDPHVLLMDEPFGALDAQTRNDMQEILVTIWKQTGKTIVFVTHSVDEAIFLGEKVVIVSGKPGRIKNEITVDLPYPRYRTAPEFVSLRERVLMEIRSPK